MLNRKNAHLYNSLRLSRRGDFKNYTIKTIEPSNLNWDQLDTRVDFLGRTIAFPNYINAMTGGTSLAKKYNHRLVSLAKDFGLPIMTGSMNPLIKHGNFLGFEPFLDYDFVIANLSARNSLEDLKKVADRLRTPYVSIHLNTMQELLQHEGDRDFRDEIRNIESAVKHFGDHLIVKGVGQGFSKESIRILRDIGVKNLDISGAGGTDFSKIELMRTGENFSYPNISTSRSILNADGMGLNIIASGGIDSEREIFLSLALGANITASAYFYLSLVGSSRLEARARIESRMENFKKYMLISSSKSLKEIKNKYEVIK